MSQQCMELAQQVQEPALLLQAHHAMAGVYALLAPDKMELALAHAKQALAIYDPTQHHTHIFHYGGHDPGVCCRQLSARLLWLLGYPDQARHSAQASLQLAQQLPYPTNIVFALNNTAAIHIHLREPSIVLEMMPKAIPVAIKHEMPISLAQGLIQHGWALAMQGDVEQGIVEFQQGLTSWKALAAVLHLSYFPLLLAEVHLKARQPEAGLAAVEEALAAATAYDDHYWEAEIHRLRGELLLMARKSTDEAEAAFHQGLQVARRQQAKSLELCATVSLCRLWQQQGKSAKARALLSAIYNWFTEGFDTADLREAKALLDELNSICRA